MRNEPRTLAQTQEWLHQIQLSFLRDEHYRFAIFDHTETHLLGEVMLIRRNPVATTVGFHGTGPASTERPSTEVPSTERPGTERTRENSRLPTDSAPPPHELGYWLHVDHTSRGYATEAARALVSWVLDYFQHDFVELQCEVENSASVRLAQRLHFQHTGSEPGETTDGERCDLQVWRLSREAYRCRRESQHVRAFDEEGKLVFEQLGE